MLTEDDEDVKLLGIEREGKEVFNKINLKNYTQRVFSMFGGEQQVITIQFINPLLDTVVDRFGKKGMLYNIVDDRHFSITAPVGIQWPVLWLGSWFWKESEDSKATEGS